MGRRGQRPQNHVGWTHACTCVPCSYSCPRTFLCSPKPDGRMTIGEADWGDGRWACTLGGTTTVDWERQCHCNGQTNEGTDAYLCRIHDPRIAGGVAESKIILALKAAVGRGGGGEKAHNEEQRGYGKTCVKPPFKGGDRLHAGRHLPTSVARPNASSRAPPRASSIDRLGQSLPPLTLSQSPLIALPISSPMLPLQTHESSMSLRYPATSAPSRG
jgi:hypothetical protein